MSGRESICDSAESPDRIVKPQMEEAVGASMSVRRGKAPPVDPFSGEDEGIRLNGWLPALARASTWNVWSEEGQLLQLAGHLRGHALQEWELIPHTDKGTYESAVEALRERLDPGGRMLAIQDFRHASQRDDETLSGG